MQITRDQLQAMTADRHGLLRHDLAIHLMEFRPQVFEAYPAPYVMAMIDDSLALALEFGFKDVQAMRVFLQLRWDVAPGFYLQPDLARGIRQYASLGMDCWDQLSQPDWGDAWLQAHEFDQPQHWHARIWGEKQQ